MWRTINYKSNEKNSLKWIDVGNCNYKKVNKTSTNKDFVKRKKTIFFINKNWIMWYIVEITMNMPVQEALVFGCFDYLAVIKSQESKDCSGSVLLILVGNTVNQLWRPRLQRIHGYPNKHIKQILIQMSTSLQKPIRLKRCHGYKNKCWWSRKVLCNRAWLYIEITRDL